MALDLDRIRALAEDPSVDLPDITFEQAIATNRLFEYSERDRLARERRERAQRR